MIRGGSGIGPFDSPPTGSHWLSVDIRTMTVTALEPIVPSSGKNWHCTLKVVAFASGMLVTGVIWDLDFGLKAEQPGQFVLVPSVNACISI